MRATYRLLLPVILLLSFHSLTAAAKDPKHKKDRTRALYFSWGYNEEWYTRSTVYVKQGALGNNFEMVHVDAQDHKGWDHNFFHEAWTIPQYNYRIGMFINKKQDLALEFNFDHTKYIINDGEQVHVTGTINSQPLPANATINFSQKNGFYYFLNNGANFFLFNIVKRLQIYRAPHNYFRLDALGKAGIGPVVPHVQNSFFGKANDPHFQFGGWNTGIETAVRATIMRYAYLEFSQKVDYARYNDLKSYDGTARQNFGCYELILSFGVTIPTTKHNPLFAH